MKPQIPWLRVFVEGVVIVGESLRAFGIQAAWDELQERVEEQEILAHLEADMVNNRADLERASGGNERTTEGFQAFLAMTPEALSDLPEDSASNLLRSLVRAVTFTPFDGTLRTADLSLLHDARTREAVGSWMGRADDVTEGLPALVASWSESYSSIGSPALTVDGGYETPSEGPTAASILGGLREDESFLRARLIHQFVLNITLRKIGVLTNLTDELLELIRHQRR